MSGTLTLRYCVCCYQSGKKYKVVIEGHADEISWFVNYISDKGYISVIRNGEAII